MWSDILAALWVLRTPVPGRQLRDEIDRAEAVFKDTTEEHEANAAWLPEVQALLGVKPPPTPNGETP